MSENVEFEWDELSPEMQLKVMARMDERDKAAAARELAAQGNRGAKFTSGPKVKPRRLDAGNGEQLEVAPRFAPDYHHRYPLMKEPR